MSDLCLTLSKENNYVFLQVDPRNVIIQCFLGLIPLLFFVSFLTYLDRGSVSFGSLQFKKDIGLTSTNCESPKLVNLNFPKLSGNDASMESVFACNTAVIYQRKW